VSDGVVRPLLKGVPFIKERVSNNPSPTYDESIVEELARDPKVMKLANLPQAFDGVLSLSKYAKSRSRSIETVRKVIKKNHMPIGEFGFGPRSKPATGLLPADQRFIDEKLEEKSSE
jgi:hypothetical protein